MNYEQYLEMQSGRVPADSPNPSRGPSYSDVPQPWCLVAVGSGGQLRPLDGPFMGRDAVIGAAREGFTGRAALFAVQHKDPLVQEHGDILIRKGCKVLLKPQSGHPLEYEA